MCDNQNQSWLDMLDSSNSSFEDSKNEKTVTPKKVVKERNIEIKILDSENEKKFDKLVSENKLKSPFKRRHSNEKLDNEADDENKTDSKKIKQDESDERASSRNGRKKFRTESTTSASDNSSTYSSNSNLASLQQRETDPAVLERRQKQIDYGKNTVGYFNYIKKVPKDKRTREHPKTPPKHNVYSRRCWEGLVKAWRKKLHAYDDGDEEENE